MSAALVSVHLHGALGEQFGTTHAFAVRSPREAVRALEANYPAFRAAFLATDRYAIFADGDWRDVEGAAIMPVSREIHFCPRIEGRQFIGAALVGALIPALAGTLAADIIGGVIIAGLLLGVSLLFAPKATSMDDTQAEDDSQSYAFTGAVNVTAQGAAVPVIYGRVYTGSVVVSAGLDVGDQVVLNSSQGTMFAALEDFNEPRWLYAVPDGVAIPRTGWPAMVPQLIGPPEGKVRRTAPQGWAHLGSETFLENDQRRVLELWVSPDRAVIWDYWRGFRNYRPSEMVGT